MEETTPHEVLTVEPQRSEAVWPQAQSAAAPTSSQRSHWAPKPLIPVAIVALIAGSIGGYLGRSGSGGGVSIQTSSDRPGATVLPSGKTIPALVKAVTPAIVSIDVKDSYAEEQGTGMIISANGTILTNAHVVSGALSGGAITVTQTGSTVARPATLIGSDPTNDVALIRINGASSMPTVTFGKSASLEVGDAVVAIGNALGLAASTPSVTQGIVSALGRTVTASSGSGGDSETLTNMIQTDAAINPGNSGGPLLDSSGHVIGMNTAVAGTLSDGSSAQNIGFAIPAAKAESLIAELLKGGTLANRHAFLGVQIETMTTAIAKQYGLTFARGALVVSVSDSSAAATAGVQAGDIIEKLGRSVIRTAEDVAKFTKSHRGGQRTTVTVHRSNKVVVLPITLGYSQ